MSVNYGSAVSWSLGLGILGGSIAGSVVSARAIAQGLQLVGGFIVLFTAAVYVLILRQRAVWQRKHPFVRFVVFFVSLLVASVALTSFVGLFVRGAGPVTQAVEVLAACGAFAVTAWVTFYGGAERIWTEALAMIDFEW